MSETTGPEIRRIDFKKAVQTVEQQTLEALLRIEKLLIEQNGRLRGEKTAALGQQPQKPKR